MEEKLYFKPGNYGKGTKKKPVTHGDDKDNSDNPHRLRNFIVLILVLALIVLIIIWLLRGKTTTSGRFPENVKNESLECNIANKIYDKTNNVSPANTETRVTMIFYGESEFSSINFRYTMHLASVKEAGEAEAITHVQFAENLGYSGLTYEEFNNKFTRIDNDLILSLYSSEKFKKDTAYEYFLINKDASTGAYPESLEDFRKNYESQGFTCKSSLDK